MSLDKQSNFHCLQRPSVSDSINDNLAHPGSSCISLLVGWKLRGKDDAGEDTYAMRKQELPLSSVHNVQKGSLQPVPPGESCYLAFQKA